MVHMMYNGISLSHKKEQNWVICRDMEGSSREGNGTHSSTLAWKIPWMEEPGGLQSMGSRRVEHD